MPASADQQQATPAAQAPTPDPLAPVLEQSLPALKDAKRIVKVFEGLGYSREKVQLVLNRFSKNSPIPVGEV